MIRPTENIQLTRPTDFGIITGPTDSELPALPTDSELPTLTTDFDVLTLPTEFSEKNEKVHQAEVNPEPEASLSDSAENLMTDCNIVNVTTELNNENDIKPSGNVKEVSYFIIFECGTSC